MPGAITRKLAAGLLAAVAGFSAPASAAAAPAASEGPGPAAVAAAEPKAPEAAPSESLNLYEDAEKTGPAAEKRPAASKDSGLSMVARVGFWLGLVIALICGAVALARKVMPRSAAWGRSQTAELVGRTYLEAKRSVYLLKVGNRVLVVGSAENGLSALGEITDRAEVDYLACLARGKAVPEPEQKSDFSRLLGGRLSRLVGLAKEGEEQVVDADSGEYADAGDECDNRTAGRSAVEPDEAVGATAAPNGLESLKEQLARLRSIS